MKTFMEKIIYVFEPPYHLYKEYQQLEKEIGEGCTDEEVIIKKEKLHKILLKEASHYLIDYNTNL